MAGWHDHGTDTTWRFVPWRLFQRSAPASTATATLPDARLLTVGGPAFFVWNAGAAGVTVQDAASGTVGTVSAGTLAAVLLVANDTAAGSWRIVAHATPSTAAAYPTPETALICGGQPDGDQTLSYYGYRDAFTTRANLPRDSFLASGASHAGLGYQFGHSASSEDATDEYNPTADTWTAKTDRPTSTIRHTAIHSDTGVHVFGGSVAGAAQRWNGTSWTTLSASLTARRDSGSARTANGASQSGLWIIGGGDVNPFGDNMIRYDTAGDTYTAVQPLPYMKRGQASVTGVGSRILVAGGVTVGAAAALDCPIYDSVLLAWTQGTGFPGPERWGAACSTIDGRATLFGGNSPVLTRRIESYDVDLNTGTWVRLSDLPAAQDSFSNQGMTL